MHIVVVAPPQVPLPSHVFCVNPVPPPLQVGPSQTVPPATKLQVPSAPQVPGVHAFPAQSQQRPLTQFPCAQLPGPEPVQDPPSAILQVSSTQTCPAAQPWA